MWVKIKSWHRVEFVTRGGLRKTYCGRYAPSTAETTDDLGNDASCESCFRVRESRG